MYIIRCITIYTIYKEFVLIHVYTYMYIHIILVIYNNQLTIHLHFFIPSFSPYIVPPSDTFGPGGFQIHAVTALVIGQTPGRTSVPGGPPSCKVVRWRMGPPRNGRKSMGKLGWNSSIGYIGVNNYIHNWFRAHLVPLK